MRTRQALSLRIPHQVRQADTSLDGTRHQVPLNAENEFLLVGARRREQRAREEHTELSLQKREVSPSEEGAGIRGQFHLRGHTPKGSEPCR